MVEESSCDERTPLPTDEIVEKVTFEPKIIEISSFNYEMLPKTKFNFEKEGMGITTFNDQIWLYGGSDNDSGMFWML